MVPRVTRVTVPKVKRDDNSTDSNADKNWTVSDVHRSGDDVDGVFEVDTVNCATGDNQRFTGSGGVLGFIRLIGLNVFPLAQSSSELDLRVLFTLAGYCMADASTWWGAYGHGENGADSAPVIISPVDYGNDSTGLWLDSNHVVTPLTRDSFTDSGITRVSDVRLVFDPLYGSAYYLVTLRFAHGGVEDIIIGEQKHQNAVTGFTPVELVNELRRDVDAGMMEERQAIGFIDGLILLLRSRNMHPDGTPWNVLMEDIRYLYPGYDDRWKPVDAQ